MTSSPNPFDEMMRFGRDMAKAMNPALEQFTAEEFEKLFPTMPKELLEGMMGKTFNPEGLDAKTRLLLTLMGLTILGAHAEAHIRLTAKHAQSAGATTQEMAETVALAGMFGGIPAMNKAMELVGSVTEPDGEES